MGWVGLLWRVGLPLTFNTMESFTFAEYLESDIRRNLYRNHPEVQKIGRMSERLKNVSDADLFNYRLLSGSTATDAELMARAGK